jgi:dTDP-4-dehydrorhamnose 3,5-epimerase
MKILETEIHGCYQIEVDQFHDNRGYFLVPYNIRSLSELPQTNFIQDNESYSVYGTIRGLHYQSGEYEQSKLVRCSYGCVMDVVVDIRENSKTFGKFITFTLDRPNKIVLVPKGCAHGFVTLSNFAIFTYKVDAPYNKESERGIIYNDPFLNIDWMIPEKNRIVSDKDLILPNFI